MDVKKIYLTKEGLEDLRKEYTELSKVKRPDVLARVSQARSMGDLSENAEYVAAREELSFIDGRRRNWNSRRFLSVETFALRFSGLSSFHQTLVT